MKYFQKFSPECPFNEGVTQSVRTLNSDCKLIVRCPYRAIAVVFLEKTLS